MHLLFLLMKRRQPRSTLFPYTTLFRSIEQELRRRDVYTSRKRVAASMRRQGLRARPRRRWRRDRKSTRLNSSHMSISYAVFCLKKKTPRKKRPTPIAPIDQEAASRTPG